MSIQITDEIVREAVKEIRTKFGGSYDAAEWLVRIAIESAAPLIELAAAKAENEACAGIVDGGQETWSNMREGAFLTPRKHGNLAGLGFATAIRPRYPTRSGGDQRRAAARRSAVIKLFAMGLCLCMIRDGWSLARRMHTSTQRGEFDGSDVLLAGCCIIGGALMFVAVPFSH